MNNLIRTLITMRYILWPKKVSWLGNPKLFHKQSRISIERVAYICKEAIDHDSSWWEFRDLVEQRLEHEEKLLLMLSRNPSIEQKGKVK